MNSDPDRQIVDACTRSQDCGAVWENAQLFLQSIALGAYECVRIMRNVNVLSVWHDDGNLVNVCGTLVFGSKRIIGLGRRVEYGAGTPGVVSALWDRRQCAIPTLATFVKSIKLICVGNVRRWRQLLLRFTHVEDRIHDRPPHGRRCSWWQARVGTMLDHRGLAAV
jgi:hypothetical protein